MKSREQCKLEREETQGSGLQSGWAPAGQLHLCQPPEERLIPPPLLRSAWGGMFKAAVPPPTPGQGQQGARHTLKNEATPSLLFNVFLLFLAVVLNLHEVGVREWIK